MLRFRVYQDIIDLILETDDKAEAVRIMNRYHRWHPDKFHELYELWDGKYNGIRQYKPGDPVIE